MGKRNVATVRYAVARREGHRNTVAGYVYMARDERLDVAVADLIEYIDEYDVTPADVVKGLRLGLEWLGRGRPPLDLFGPRDQAAQEDTTMVKYDPEKFRTSKFPKLTASDVESGGIYTIQAATLERLPNTGETLCVTFKEVPEKKLALNATNRAALEELFGAGDTDMWVGKKVQLNVVKQSAPDGRIVDAIRIAAVPTARAARKR